MIIGNGLLATAFESYPLSDDPSIIIFASGVSNSREFRETEFARERQLLLDALSTGKRVVYFSSCSILDPELADSPYVRHKIQMEIAVKASPQYAIFRLPQVVGRTKNPNTLTNYLYEKIMSDTPFQVWSHARRNLIDVSDVACIAEHLIRDVSTIQPAVNIACPFFISILDLVRIFENILKRTAHYSISDAGGVYSIDSQVSSLIAEKIGIRFDSNYVEAVLRKYYGK